MQKHVIHLGFQCVLNAKTCSPRLSMCITCKSMLYTSVVNVYKMQKHVIQLGFQCVLNAKACYTPMLSMCIKCNSMVYNLLFVKIPRYNMFFFVKFYVFFLFSQNGRTTSTCGDLKVSPWARDTWQCCNVEMKDWTGGRINQQKITTTTKTVPMKLRRSSILLALKISQKSV